MPSQVLTRLEIRRRILDWCDKLLASRGPAGATAIEIFQHMCLMDIELKRVANISEVRQTLRGLELLHYVQSRLERYPSARDAMPRRRFWLKGSAPLRLYVKPKLKRLAIASLTEFKLSHTPLDGQPELEKD